MNIETQRLIIRYFKDTDGRDLYDYLSKEEVVKYEPYDTFTLEDAKKEAVRRADDHNFYAVQLKDGKVIGNLYLAKGDFETWELGYVFNSDYSKKGYAAESAKALMAYVFQNYEVRRMIALCNPLNENSWKLLERLGFRREGTLLKNIFFWKDEKGEPIWQDTYEYGILKEEWQRNASGGKETIIPQFVSAKEGDAETFVEIQNKAFFADFQKYGECPGYGRTAESMRNSMKKNRQYKIMADNVPVGKVSAHETDGRCYLDCLCVLPEYERKGIGQAAVSFIEKQFPAAKSWSLKTPKDKRSNHSFYKKCGYNIVDEQIDGNVTVVIFWKDMEH